MNGMCKLIEEKQEFTNNFLRIIFRIKDMHKIHEEKFKNESIEACPCKYKIGDHFLSTLETNFVSLLSSFLMCLDRCIYEKQEDCNMVDIENAIYELDQLRSEIYIPPLQCRNVSTAFTKLFMDIMSPIDNYFLKSIKESLLKLADSEDLLVDMHKLEITVINYVDMFMLSLYGLAIDCNFITNYTNIDPKCIESQDCPVHKQLTQLKITVFLIDDLVEQNLLWVEHLVTTLKKHYLDLSNLNLVIDFRFIKKNVTIDLPKILTLLKEFKKSFKSIVFANANKDLKCINRLMEDGLIKNVVKTNL